MLFIGKCPNCGASIDEKIENDRHYFYCKYCGEKIYVVEETVKHHHDYNYYAYDETKVTESNNEAEIRLQELENEEREHKRNFISLVLSFLFLIFLLAFVYTMTIASGPKDSELSIPESSRYYKGLHYSQAVQELQDAGFQNIRTQKIDDLIIGFLDKEGDVERVSINGDTDFQEGDIFPKDAVVVVTYHVFKDN